MDYDPEVLVGMYRMMVKIRAFEEKVGELFMQDRIYGAVHLYSGEEAIAVGVCTALEATDYITSTHRGHGHCIAKGGDMRKMMAEVFGKASGYCKGKGGSMHIADIDQGILGANGIVGDGIGIAMGAALGIKLRKSNQVCVTFFGDGAVSTGIFHESLNMASIFKLPLLLINENNQYAVSTPFTYSSPVTSVAQRAKAYGIEGISIDGNDVLKVYQTAVECIDKIRKGNGPILIEAKTYRWEGHYKGDPEKYRSVEEVMEWREKRDPIRIFESTLLRERIMDSGIVDQIRNEIVTEIKEAVSFAEESPEPEINELHEDIYIG